MSSPGLRLGVVQEQRLRAWPKDRIRPKSVALGVMSLLAEVDALRAELAGRTRERDKARSWAVRWKAVARRYRAMLRMHRDRDMPDPARAVARVAALEVENADMRSLLVHRCAVKDLDPACEDCARLVALLDASPGQHGAAVLEALNGLLGALEGPWTAHPFAARPERYYTIPAGAVDRYRALGRPGTAVEPAKERE